MDKIFVHTDAMADIVRKINGKASIKVMHLFDYYSDDAMLEKSIMPNLKNVVAFAGNLDKSKFLLPLSQSQISPSIHFRLYGLPSQYDYSSNSQISYMGAFKPALTRSVVAGWGLLWDGESIETCTGALGNYLKINSSHKLSLYLVCGMPVILWAQSSLASWLSDQGVCILVDRLSEIPERIKELSNSEYMVMVDKARILGEKLRQGQLLASLLD